MKIITTDNFNREGHNEGLVAENVPEYWAHKILAHLRTAYTSEHGELWFEVVPDEHKLYKFEP